MNDLMKSIREENGQMRGLTGQGEPGLFTLLGGSARERDSSQYTTMGGPGQVSATTRMAQAYRDTRLAAVASGTSIPGTGGGGGDGGSPGGGGGNIPQQPV